MVTKRVMNTNFALFLTCLPGSCCPRMFTKLWTPAALNLGSIGGTLHNFDTDLFSHWVIESLNDLCAASEAW